MKVEERYEILYQLLSRLDDKYYISRFTVVHERFTTPFISDVRTRDCFITLKTAKTFSGHSLDFCMPRHHLFIPEKTMYEISGDYQDRRELGNFINKVYDKRISK